MTQTRDPDVIVAAWLESGPTELPDETRRAITVALRTQPRVRRMALPGGIIVTSISRLTVAAGLVLAVGAVGILALSNHTNGVGGQPASPSPSIAAVASVAATASHAASPASPTSPSATPSTVTTGWLSFTSDRYGYDAKYPPYLTPSQSTHQWTMADESDWLSSGHDLFKGQVAITVFAVPLSAGQTRDSWIASHVSGPTASSSDPQACTHTQATLPTTTVDGQPVVFWRESENGNCGGTFAFVANGNRLYAFFIGLPGWEPTLEGFLSTVKFHA